jgi:hypothetical protein
MRKAWLVIPFALLSANLLGQEFEVASIRVNTSDDSGKEGRRIGIEASPQA